MGVQKTAGNTISAEVATTLTERTEKGSEAGSAV